MNIWLSKKICSRSIPYNLSIAQKKARADWSKEMLQKYDRGASKHVYVIVTGHESWIYEYEPESKQQSSVWVFQDEPNQQKLLVHKALHRLFFRKNWTCRNRTTRTTQNSLFWVLRYHLFASCLPRNQKNQPPKMNHSSSRQCERSHIDSNNCIFEHSKHRFDESSAV